MNKYYNSLLLVAVVSTSGLVASENQEKPFFDESTQGVLKTAAQYYGLGYFGLHGAGTVFGPIGAWHYVNKIGILFGTFSFRKAAREMNTKIAQKHIITAPLVFGGAVAWHKYNQMKSEKVELTIGE
jgi:hypothetical protein